MRGDGALTTALAPVAAFSAFVLPIVRENSHWHDCRHGAKLTYFFETVPRLPAFASAMQR